MALRRSRPAERGRGCLVMAVLLALVVAGALVSTRALAAPDLGSPPRGPHDGDTPVGIAAALAPRLAVGLLAAPHAVLTLSEQDITVLARADNPNADGFRSPEARVRSGLLVLSGRTPVGPFTVTAVGHLRLRLQQLAGDVPRLAVDLVEVDAGDISLPGPVRDLIVRRIDETVRLDDVLAANPVLQQLSTALDCVAAASDGVRLGFHRPGTAPDPQGCTRP